MAATAEQLEELSGFLRDCVPGDKLQFECSDDATRTLAVDHRIELRNDTVMLKLSGHGARYQLNVPHEGYESPTPPLVWRSGNAIVTKATLVEESDRVWSDTTAADLGVSKR